MNFQALWILSAVSGVLLLLALVDVIRHRRITPAAKVRLLTAAIMLTVCVWLTFRPR